jgi:putative transposase
MTCKVIECKIVSSHIPQKSLEILNRMFIEAKWLYNAILSSNDINNYDTKSNEVQVKIKEKFENRHLEEISSQMKQSIKTRMFSSLSTLKALKKKGHKVGKLKFKSFINSIPLKQHNNSFAILKESKRIRIQGIKKPLKVSGLGQLPQANYEIANANLVKCGKDFYVKITIYIPKESKIVPDKTIGIDFGCSSQLTLSNGEKIKYGVLPSKRLKKLDKEKSRRIKGSKNYRKTLQKREKEYLHLTNKRKDIKNKIVHKLVNNYKVICFQDENLNEWKQNGHGKKIQFSAIGGIITALKNKADTPIVIDKYYPSTQLCSNCGNKQKIGLHEREYVCASCESKMDRDINSAINILKEGIKNLVQKIPTGRREFKPVETGISSHFSALQKYEKVQSLKQETLTSLVSG